MATSREIAGQISMQMSVYYCSADPSFQLAAPAATIPQPRSSLQTDVRSAMPHSAGALRTSEDDTAPDMATMLEETRKLGDAPGACACHSLRPSLCARGCWILQCTPANPIMY